jgi:glycosyltransferase involved in cell wall biosynthesis
MLISIGLQNKILQAMAMKIPCVISPMANNALGAVHGEHLFVAETPEQYATYISQLIKDEALCNKITESAYAFVRQHFSWSGALRPVIDALQV